MYIGKETTIGHRALLHACTIGDKALIGMGATVLNGAVVKNGAMVAAGALVTQNAIIEEGMLAVGVPAKVKRPVSDFEKNDIEETIEEYRLISEEYLKED